MDTEHKTPQTVGEIPVPLAAPSPSPEVFASTQAAKDKRTDETESGQRRVNLIWEATQALIALGVVGAVLAICMRIAFAAIDLKVPEVLQNALFLIVGFYFSRTNHAAIGGVGNKPSGPYVGR